MRYRTVDAIRGLTIISMILYHACWDLVYLAGMDFPFYRGKAGFLWQQSICMTFILVSGFSAGLGSHPVRRGLVVSLWGLVVTAVTMVFLPEERIVFGILTFLGSAMLITGACQNGLDRLAPLWGLIGSGLLFVLWYPVNRGYLAMGTLWIALPQTWYADGVATYLGFMEPGFFSTDYFSLLPWLFLFWAGYFLCRLLRQRSQLGLLERELCPPLGWLGRHSLVCYLLHQPVLYGLLQCAWLFGRR